MTGQLSPRRAAFLIEVDLDPIPGFGHTRDSWKRWLEFALDAGASHYRPTVTDAAQLQNRPAPGPMVGGFTMCDLCGALVDYETGRALHDAWHDEQDEARQHLADAAELNRANCERANRAEMHADGLRKVRDQAVRELADARAQLAEANWAVLQERSEMLTERARAEQAEATIAAVQRLIDVEPGHENDPRISKAMIRAALAAAGPSAPETPTCGCSRCDSERRAALPWPERLAGFMIVCSECGNKRCPRAAWHGNICTGSNEPGQPGSDYPAPASSDELRAAWLRLAAAGLALDGAEVTIVAGPDWLTDAESDDDGEVDDAD